MASLAIPNTPTINPAANAPLPVSRASSGMAGTIMPTPRSEAKVAAESGIAVARNSLDMVLVSRMNYNTILYSMLTFEEVKSSPEFGVIEKSRLGRVQQATYEQLDAVFG